jgi:hypothetical protein
MGALSLVRGFSGPPSPHYPVAYKEQPGLSVYIAIMEPFQVIPEIKEKLDIGNLSPLFLPFTEKF